MNVLRGVVAFRWTRVRLDSPCPFRVRSNLLERRAQCSAPCAGIRPAAPGPYGWGYGGWAPGYGVNYNYTAVAPHPYWNGAPQAIGPLVTSAAAGPPN